MSESLARRSAPPPRPPRLGAADVLGRGFRNLAANWPVVVWMWLVNIPLILLIASAAVVFFAMAYPGGLDGLVELADSTDPDVWIQALLEIWHQLVALSPRALGGLAAALALSLLAFLLSCWIWAGIYGVLWGGDAQAPPGSRDRRLFRTWSFTHFAGWGGRYLWRVFWFVNLYFLVLSLLLLLWALLAAGAVWGSQRWGAPAGFAIGCGGSLPILFLFLATIFWYYLGLADVVRPDSGVLPAARVGLDVLGRRLGTNLLLFLAFFVPTLILVVGFAFVDFGLQLALGEGVAYWAAYLALQLVQQLATAFFTLFYAAAAIALVRSELPRRRRPVPGRPAVPDRTPAAAG